MSKPPLSGMWTPPDLLPESTPFETRWGTMTVTHSPRGVPTYRVEVSHDGLHKYTVIKAGDPVILAKKLQTQVLQWNAAWEKQWTAECRIRRTRDWKEERRLHIERQKEVAVERTTEAQELLETLKSLLVAGIELDPTLDWEQRKVRTPFPVDAPKSPDFPREPAPRHVPPAPDRSAATYQVTLSVLDRLIASRKRSKLAEADKRFVTDMKAWHDLRDSLSAEHTSESRGSSDNLS